MPLEPPEYYIGPRVKFLTHAFTRKFLELARAGGVDEVTIMHGQILGYLYRCGEKGQPVYQKDLEETFHITRSSVTGVVQLMERKGYIHRRSVPGDARLKELFLTDLGTQACKEAWVAFQQVEDLAIQGLTQEQVDTFLALCDHIHNNLNPQKECAHAHDKNHPSPSQRV